MKKIKLDFNELKYKITKPFYNLETLLRRIIRLYHWSKFMWTNWDFDAHSIYSLLNYKLKRLEYCLINGCAIQEKKDLKALKVAIKLSQRIYDEVHEDRLMEKHYKKWGILIDGIFHSKNKKLMTGEQNIQYRKEFIQYNTLAQKLTDNDKKRLFAIITKYDNRWWD